MKILLNNNNNNNASFVLNLVYKLCKVKIKQILGEYYYMGSYLDQPGFRNVVGRMRLRFQLDMICDI